MCAHTSLLHSAHLSTALVSDAPTHSRWLKSCHTTEFHLSVVVVVQTLCFDVVCVCPGANRRCTEFGMKSLWT